MNNRTKIMVTSVLLMSSILFAQHKPDKDKIKSLKVAFLTERLDLSSKEAQTFWPIYNEYNEKRDAMHEQKQDRVYRKMGDVENLSEKEAGELIKQYLTFEENEEELDKNFTERISKVISAKKTLLLLRSEYEFKKQLLKQYRHNKE
ncbi:hypothetical protein SAMN05421636_106251 [Pricia antarctica]|uniref:Sensor of ECF-type sigma factor n=1 Tax=Pricia antarctica TaxID=641691 RepID=A0A1G7EMI9_9FLAO|nr:hypothetical protein [Pricia antarctica]SDE64861.1 hypothetical protein SAMN05421636_106251 [Pricia antarctica]